MLTMRPSHVMSRADVLVVRGEPAADVSVLQDPAIMQGGAFWKMAPQLTAA